LIAQGFVDFNLGRDGARGVCVVAGQHDCFDAQLM